MSNSPLSLRTLLLADALTCTAMGVFLMLGSAAVGPLTRIPPALLFYVGIGLVPIAAFMAFVAPRAAALPAAVRLIIAGNVAWVAGSLLLLVTPWIIPNTLGILFIAAQAVFVAVLAWLEQRALNRETFRSHAAQAT